MRPTKRFLYCLQNGSDNTIPYVDNDNVMQVTTAASGQRVWLNSSPVGWLETEVSFGRSDEYKAINRAYTEALRFLNDGKQIINNKFFLGKMFEQKLNLIILEWDDQTDVYELYYKGLIDLTNRSEQAGQGVEVSTMEAGAGAILKGSAGNTYILACDGSIPENEKINYDGVYYPDKLYFQFVPMTMPTDGHPYILATNFVEHEGDNFNIAYASQTLQDVFTTANYSVSGNSTLFSGVAIKVKVEGYIILRPFNSNHPVDVSIALQTPKFVNIGFADQFLHTIGLVPGSQQGRATITTPGGAQLFPNLHHVVHLTKQTIYYFSQEMSLDALENMFVVGAQFGDPGHSFTIVGGSFDVEFVSKAADTRVWAMTARNCFKLLVQRMNLSSSTTELVYNYIDQSTLLDKYLNLMVTSGDALRASGDPNYQKYYNTQQINPNFPSLAGNMLFGPGIKISMNAFHKSFSAILCAALGAGQQDGQAEALFFESLTYVFDPTLDPAKLVKLGEASKMKVSTESALIFNKIKIGYPEQQYDQKDGKFETNTTLQMIAPVISEQRDLDLVSEGRADIYGMERLRANIQAQSSTRNGSDNSWFIVNVDRDKWIYDFWKGVFTSSNQVFDQEENTNINFVPLLHGQSIDLTQFNGNAFQVRNETSIFVFNQPGSALRAIRLQITGQLTGNTASAITGLPADTVTISLYKNSTILQTFVITVSGAATPINIDYTTNQDVAFKDCVYVRMSTSVGGSAVINPGSLLSVDAAYFTAANDGEVDVQPGTALQFLPMTNITTTQVVVNGVARDIVSYGFQYFVYNNIQLQNNFDYVINVFGITKNNTPADVYETDLFFNGFLIGTRQALGTGVPNAELPFSHQFAGNRTFAFGDFIFLLADDFTNQLAQITAADFTLTSTQIKAYMLKRVLYDYIAGVPLYVASDQPGAPYNIEQLRPFDMMTAWSGHIRGVLNNLVPGVLQFSDIDKNQFLSTIKDGVVKTDNAPREIGSLGSPFYFPLILEVEINVPARFAMQYALIVNQHVNWTWNGVDYYGFPMKMTKKAMLNEPQKWLFRASPVNDLRNFIDLDFDGLKLIKLMVNEIFVSRLSPIQIVPMNKVFDGKYHFRSMDDALFKDQLQRFHQKESTYIPVQNNDMVIPLQFFSGGVSPVTVNLYNCDDQPVSSTVMTIIATDALSAPLKLFQGNIDVSTLPEGTYYFTVFAGDGSGAMYISESLWVKPDWPDTVLVEYSHSRNKLSMIFGQGYTGRLRVHGCIDDYTPKSRSTEYEDEPGDIQIIDGIHTRVHKIYLGAQRGVPDSTIDKMDEIMNLDTTFIENYQWSRNGTVDWDKNATPGLLEKYWALEIREAKNKGGNTLDTGTGDTSGNRLLYNIRNRAFGSDSGDNTITQVTEIET